jgi:hypothetical protein
MVQHRSVNREVACMPFVELRQFIPPVGRSSATNTCDRNGEDRRVRGQRSHEIPVGQTWLPVSEPLALNPVFDLLEEIPKPGLLPPSHLHGEANQGPIELRRHNLAGRARGIT